jgi:pyruvate/2-oxoglutarate dehydrogenase complex dihydrolipoamide acyltransferase (E2) component
MGTTRHIAVSSNRRRIYHFLTRGLRFHANATTVFEYDVTDLLSSIAGARSRGEGASLHSAMVRATSLVVERYPQFNRHLFHGLFGRYVVEFGGIHCGMMISRRTEEGEDVLFPAVIRDANKLTIGEIERIVLDYRNKPLMELPEYRALYALRRMPEIGRVILSLRAKSDHRFYERAFAATYGLSSFAGGKTSAPAHATQTISPTAATFFPGRIADRAWVHEGAIAIRKILPLSLTVDHYLLDGSDIVVAMDYLRELLEDPTLLGLPAPASTAKSNGAHAEA